VFRSVILALLALPVPAGADPYPRQPGIDVQHYTFRLTLGDANDSIRGEATLDVRLVAEGISSVTLDLIGRGEDRKGMVVTSVTRDGRPLAYVQSPDRLVIRLDAPSAAGERQQYTIVYEGVPADGLFIGRNRHGDRTFFADNFPDRARGWIPTVDHPSDKAACEFAVTAPSRYQVVASGRLIEETDLGGELTLTRWRESAPIATYLMVIGVARFAVAHLGRVEGVPVQTWVYPQDRDPGFFDFARAGRSLEFFSHRVGPYAYEKLANVQSTTRYGGMENAGNIFYGERAVTGARRVEGTVVHEVAHQWFGDAVTESDWNHAWLSEGFATYFAHLFDEWAYGRERLVAGMVRDREAVARFRDANPDLRVVDRRVPIRQVLSPYTYQKGGWVLHMLRRMVGDAVFRTGVSAYYARYRNGNALSEDFARVMEEVSGRNLSRFFRQWLYEPGHPSLAVTWRYDAAAQAIDLAVDQTQDGPAFAFDLDVGVVGANGARRVATVSVAERRQTFTVPAAAEPASLELDPDAWLLFEGTVQRR